MRSMFEDCVDMEGSIEALDVSNVEDMSYMVRACVLEFLSIALNRETE